MIHDDSDDWLFPFVLNRCTSKSLFPTSEFPNTREFQLLLLFNEHVRRHGNNNHKVL